MITSPKPADAFTRRLAQLESEAAANRVGRKGYSLAHNFTAFAELHAQTSTREGAVR